MNGRSTSASAGFGWVSVSGRSRVPSPPTSTRARISSSAPHGGRGPATDPLVGEARGLEPPRIEEVAPVHDQRVRHPPGELLPVELGELGPFGDQDRRIGALERVDGRLSDLDLRQQLACSIPGDRVVRD